MFGGADPTPDVAPPVGQWYLPRLSASSRWADASLADQIDAIAALQPDWDGYGAAKIEPTALAAARQLLGALQPMPEIILPASGGTLVLEWETVLGRAHLELGRQTYSFYAAPRNGQPIFLSGDVREEDAEDFNYALATITGSSSQVAVSRGDWRGGLALLDEGHS